MRSAYGDIEVATLATPLVREADAIGAMSFIRVDLAKPYSALDLEIGPIVADLAAMAITNARLHRQMSEAAVRLADRPRQSSAPGCLARRLAASRGDSLRGPSARRPSCSTSTIWGLQQTTWSQGG
jgi:GAF domain-containing protein